jgi:hypothetical protein
MRPRQQSSRTLQRKCDAWNQRHPIGTDVIVKRDDGTFQRTTSRGPAYVLSGHSAVIMLEGISGVYLLDRVSPATGTRVSS